MKASFIFKLMALVALFSTPVLADPEWPVQANDHDDWQQLAAEGFDEEGDPDSRPGAHRIEGDACDDGNDAPNDGCSAGKVEKGYICVNDPSRCFKPLPYLSKDPFHPVAVPNDNTEQVTRWIVTADSLYGALLSPDRQLPAHRPSTDRDASTIIIDETGVIHDPSANIPASSSNIPASSANVPASSANVPASSANVPASSESIPDPSANVPASSANVPASSENVPASSENVPASSEKHLDQREDTSCQTGDCLQQVSITRRKTVEDCQSDFDRFATQLGRIPQEAGAVDDASSLFFGFLLNAGQTIEISQHGVLETAFSLYSPDSQIKVASSKGWGYYSKPLRYTPTEGECFILRVSPLQADLDQSFDLRFTITPAVAKASPKDAKASRKAKKPARKTKK